MSPAGGGISHRDFSHQGVQQAAQRFQAEAYMKYVEV